ncbi:uncharacterized protein LODBEIA_P51530 [Lodderomyces beijingensis]|uniref:CSN8/PSMD8/EIF3K domain-containing protein n=1 Tax=Lodderomyces beijingensis TaxID=1775926 RepID=A0ABP0ZS35_9ASCO
MDDSLKNLLSRYSLDELDLAQSQTQRAEPIPDRSPSSGSLPVATDGNSTYVPPHRARSKTQKRNANGRARNGTFAERSDHREKVKDKQGEAAEEETAAKLAQRRARFATSDKAGSNQRHKQHEYGLVSRGEDKRLQESEAAREEYFVYILSQFIRFTSAHSSVELSEAFQKTRDSDPENFRTAQSSAEEDSSQGAPNITMDSITLSIRKLRESLLGLPPSPFHKKVFLFSVRISHYFSHYQTYISSIRYLLHNESALNLAEFEVEEISVILVLHLCNVNNDPSSAIAIFYKYIPHRQDIATILRCWVLKDFYSWLKIYNEVENSAVKSMMKLGLQTMLNWMVRAITSGYYTLQKEVIETNFLPSDLPYAEFAARYNISWHEEENDMITIRSRVKKWSR